MPWPGPRRTLVGTKMDAETIAALDARAEDEDLMLPRGEPNRSELVRLLVDYGLKHMPKGWRP